MSLNKAKIVLFLVPYKITQPVLRCIKFAAMETTQVKEEYTMVVLPLSIGTSRSKEDAVSCNVFFGVAQRDAKHG